MRIFLSTVLMGTFLFLGSGVTQAYAAAPCEKAYKNAMASYKKVQDHSRQALVEKILGEVRAAEQAKDKGDKKACQTRAKKASKLAKGIGG